MRPDRRGRMHPGTLDHQVAFHVVGMFRIVAATTSSLAILQTSSPSLQRIDHDRQAGVCGSWTMAGLTGDGGFGVQHWVIRIVEGGVAALAIRIDLLIFAQRGVCTRMRAQGPGRVDGAVTSATRQAADGSEPVPSGILRQGRE